MLQENLLQCRARRHSRKARGCDALLSALQHRRAPHTRTRWRTAAVHVAAGAWLDPRRQLHGRKQARDGGCAKPERGRKRRTRGGARVRSEPTAARRSEEQQPGVAWEPRQLGERHFHEH